METQASATAEAPARAAVPPTPMPGLSGATEAPPSSFFEALGALWGDARGVVAERLKLATLELRLAAMTLLQVVMLAVVVAVLAVTAWLCLVGGVVAAFVAMGLHWGLALGLVVLINAVVAALLVRQMLHAFKQVGLPRTLRRLDKQPEV